MSTGVREVGPGDFILDTLNKKHEILRIEHKDKPKSWIVFTTDGQQFDMFHINRYLKREEKL